ncbi:sensor histidine kinase [Bacillus solimangrovi]|uniref:histidine kinase n=1 Tax=Bacillus solimangrovi TaxID=1305675 RepID=A0A1E5LHG0_9BACI|nr:sensor histidine kinase [Bacillus solimangrovi]OEH93496.1 histidine kinase [Bacillus solimangrovi]
MWYLLLTMLERIGIIVTVAFLMTRVRFFQSVVNHQDVRKSDRTIVFIMFGIFGVIGTYTGLSVNAITFDMSKWTFFLSEDEALANSRVIGVVVGGLLGGWKVGLGAGLIAGIHRFTLGGFTAIACGLSSVVAGLLSGYIGTKMPRYSVFQLKVPLLIGAAAEALQMLIILLVAKPFDAAWSLVGKIGIPMIVANGVGCALFVLVIRSVFNEQEKVGALQAHKALLLAKLTTSHLRRGLTEETASETCTVLLNEVSASAIAITDCEKVLAFIGNGADHHLVGETIQTHGTKQVIQTGEFLIANKEFINCNDESCPLHAAVISPLKRNGEVIGTMKLYFQSEKEITKVTLEFIDGLSSLLSQQLEIANSQKYIQLAKEAEIRALQAQVSPHFLFNALNTIVSMIRTQPNEARKLLISLSKYLRQNLSGTTEKMTTLNDEIKHVKAYLAIEQARFQDKLHVNIQVDDEVLLLNIPPMTLQPLIENAIKHGLKGMHKDSYVGLFIHKEAGGAKITVTDNGIGFKESVIKDIFEKPIASGSGTGLGLYNVNQRLRMLFGPHSSLCLKENNEKGASIQFYIPNVTKVE